MSMKVSFLKEGIIVGIFRYIQIAAGKYWREFLIKAQPAKRNSLLSVFAN